jgi:hypothetical protein
VRRAIGSLLAGLGATLAAWADADAHRDGLVADLLARIAEMQRDTHADVTRAAKAEEER